MRKPRPLDALLPRIRQAILAATLAKPEHEWYLGELARHLHVQPSSLQRELATLTAAGILRKRREGNRVYFQPDPDCPFLPELRGLLIKTAGLRDALRDALAPLAGRIRWAFVYGSVARGQEASGSDVDVMIIGDVGSSEVSPLLHEAEMRLGREVNSTVYSLGEFTKKLHAGYGFHRGVLDGAKLFLIGGERDLEAALERRPRRSGSGVKTGT